MNGDEQDEKKLNRDKGDEKEEKMLNTDIQDEKAFILFILLILAK